MSIGGIMILSGIFILVGVCLHEIVACLTNKHQNKNQNIENEKHIEQNTSKTEQNTSKKDESQIGKKVIIDDVKCTVIDVNQYGEPCAWLSDVLPLNIEPPHKWCSREYAMSLKFNNGWHIPSYNELLKYEQNIRTSCGSVICWTTTFYDYMCHYGDPNDIFGARRDVRIIKTI